MKELADLQSGVDEFDGVGRLIGDARETLEVLGDEQGAADEVDRLVGDATARVDALELAANFDRFDLESDANGSAKIARLIIGDSRRAWRVLMELGRAAADGVPMGLLRVLDEIDSGLAQRFPRAMAFVRPGFDTEGVVS